MPIRYRIDHERRLVVAAAAGVLSHTDFLDYQREVWSRPDVQGYDELVDTTDVKVFPASPPPTQAIVELAELAAEMDPAEATSKFAIVAPADVAFGLGRMFQTHRGLKEKSTKEVGVFRSRDEALAFLGISGPLPIPPGD